MRGNSTSRPLLLLLSTAAAAAAAAAVQDPPTPPLPFRRPPPEERAFRSPAVDTYLDTVYPRFKVRMVQLDQMTTRSLGWRTAAIYLLSQSIKCSIHMIQPTNQPQDRDLATLFSNCLPNTLDTTVRAVNDTDAFVITGRWKIQYLCRMDGWDGWMRRGGLSTPSLPKSICIYTHPPQGTSRPCGCATARSSSCRT